MTENIDKIKKDIDKTKSLYDQSRDTVGKIYRDTKMNVKAEPILVGDMANAFVGGLVDDINNQIKILDPFYLSKGTPYYLIMVEKRDLQMPDRMDRLFSHRPFRPWPEANTTVFWKDPKTQELRFCWSLPHRAEMIGILQNPEEWDPHEIWLFRCWEKFDLRPFGFYHHTKEKWIPNPSWKDKPIEEFGKRRKAESI